MDKEEAKFILQSYRRSDGDHPAFTEARDLVQKDQELKIWWEEQNAFDQIMVQKLKQVPIPNNLRLNILAGQRVARFSRKKHAVYLWALAALIMSVLIAGLSQQLSGDSSQLKYTQFQENLFPYIASIPDLDIKEENSSKIMKWLAAQGAPTAQLTSSMEQLSTLGCKKIMIQGHAVSLICFKMQDGQIAHLFVMKRNDVKDLPVAPIAYAQKGSWNTATWADKSAVYLVATQANEVALKKLI